MEFSFPLKVLEIVSRVKNEGYDIYLVGGAVRDLLLNREIFDWDFATNATPENILNIFPDGFYDNLFGTVGIKPDKEGLRPYEITTFRKEEGYSDTRHPDRIIWGKTIHEDLARREATISAMALNIKTFTKKEGGAVESDIIDPYGGQKDLRNKIFRAVGEPAQRYQEDALRMIRAIRISAQLNLTIEEKTLNGIKANAVLINKIAKERIREELFKIIASDYPSEGITILRNTGLLEQILPEIEKCFGIEQKSPGRHHLWDVGTHSLMALKFCKSGDPVVRFATLIHDIGKASTYKKLDSGTITFYNHEMVSTRIAGQIAHRLRFSSADREKLVTLVRWHQFSVDERQTDSAIRRFIKNVGHENIENMLALRTADRLGGGARETSWRLEEFKKRLANVQKQPFSLKDLKIDGFEIMKTLNLKPGPEVGNILNKLFNEVVENKLPNKKEVLLQKIKNF